MLVLSPNGYLAECYVNFKAHENDTKVFFLLQFFDWPFQYEIKLLYRGTMAPFKLVFNGH